MFGLKTIVNAVKNTVERLVLKYFGYETNNNMILKYF
jgi:hypothetical protein